MDELINFWRGLKIGQSLLVHPEDEQLINANNYYKNFNDYKNDPNFGLDDTKFRLGLIPIPYIGDIYNAKIYILMLNPGFSILDYYAESNDRELRKALIDNLRQENLDRDYPFIFLNPKFLWHGGGQYWEKKFKGLIEKVAEDNVYSYIQALSHIAKRVAVLQLVPYHSKKYKLSNKLCSELESPKKIFSFVKEKLLLEAENGEKCIIWARGKKWKLEEDNNVIVYSNNHSRVFHLSLKILGEDKWNKLFEFLR